MLEMLVRTLNCVTLLFAIAQAVPLDSNEVSAVKLRDALVSRASANFTPPGGVGASPNDPPPVYHAETDYDFQSFALALNQEYIELDLFHNGLARFSDAEFDAAGINAEQRFLLQFMADQEVSHSELLTNIIGSRAPKQCTYQYPFHNVRQFLDFSQKLTRFGESGVYGFLAHLKNRAIATLLTQAITTEARQQLIFRQMAGAFPITEHFIAGLPQAWAWTMLSPYLKSCPKGNPFIEFQIFPSLNVTNNPSLIDTTTSGEIVSHPSGTSVYYPIGSNTTSNSSSIYLSAVSHNRTTLSYPGREVNFTWEAPGRGTSYDPSKYKTHSDAGSPKYAFWVSQLNGTYTPLYNIDLRRRTASTRQPNGTVFPIAPNAYAQNSPVPGARTNNNGIVNGTMFVALTDSNLYVTSYNLSLVNPCIVAGPAIYQAD